MYNHNSPFERDKWLIMRILSEAEDYYELADLLEGTLRRVEDECDREDAMADAIAEDPDKVYEILREGIKEMVDDGLNQFPFIEYSNKEEMLEGTEEELEKHQHITNRLKNESADLPIVFVTFDNRSYAEFLPEGVDNYEKRSRWAASQINPRS